MQQDKILIGTFVKGSHVPQKILKSIVENFGADKIFIFSVNDSRHQRLVTFNVSDNQLGEKFVEFKKSNKNSLRLHRRKDSNTFYTINSLNKLIESKNGGTLNPGYKVDWNEFKNQCLVLDKDGQVKCLETKLAKIIDYKTGEKTYDEIWFK